MAIKERVENGVTKRWCPKHNNGEGAWLDASFFHQGLTVNQCKGCRNAYYRGKHDAAQQAIKNYLSYRDMDYESFVRILLMQSGCCALCSRKPADRNIGKGRMVPALNMEYRNGHPYALLCDVCYSVVRAIHDGAFTLKDVKEYIGNDLQN